MLTFRFFAQKVLDGGRAQAEKGLPYSVRSFDIMDHGHYG